MASLLPDSLGLLSATALSDNIMLGFVRQFSMPRRRSFCNCNGHGILVVIFGWLPKASGLFSVDVRSINVAYGDAKTLPDKWQNNYVYAIY